MAEVVIPKDGKQSAPKVTVESIYNTLTYTDQLVVYANYKDDMQLLVDKDTFLKQLEREKTKEVK